MSLYGSNIKIDGVICGIVMKDSSLGHYSCVFEREYASIDDIEAINWAKPVIEGETVLPYGYGFNLDDISYSSNTKSYTAKISTQKQYLGDVEDATSRIEELNNTVIEKDNTISEKDNTIVEKDQIIAEKDKEIEEKDKTITDLTNANTTLNEQLIQLANDTVNDTGTPETESV